jgi:catechol 2,3-dioxygenase-like lactoylglutathione lyase family enzyme
MPVSDTVLAIDHVQITIPTGREEEARRFYVDLLGLIEIPKPEALQGRGGFWLMAGQLPLHIGTEPEWDRTQTKAHIAFTVADVDAWRLRFIGAGYAAVEAISIPGRDRFESLDPFGNRLEIIGPATA